MRQFAYMINTAFGWWDFTDGWVLDGEHNWMIINCNLQLIMWGIGFFNIFRVGISLLYYPIRITPFPESHFLLSCSSYNLWRDYRIWSVDLGDITSSSYLFEAYQSKLKITVEPGLDSDLWLIDPPFSPLLVSLDYIPEFPPLPPTFCSSNLPNTLSMNTLVLSVEFCTRRLLVFLRSSSILLY